MNISRPFGFICPSMIKRGMYLGTPGSFCLFPRVDRVVRQTFLTQNSAQLLYEHLGGAAVSIVRICAKKPRATQEIQPRGR